MKEAGFTVLFNQNKKIMAGNGDYITITGLDDFWGSAEIRVKMGHILEFVSIT
ncbi:hypothetical protein [Bacillus thuringiensis]|uniref:hypothetical protein n=1 Tax=Bacillus thuringiensis TaxID=1428 RepID=UPI001364B3E1|nr:hypothetical protein [Bacillus thuringiensis]NUW50730.1 hypothetical protein [Bacillus thuringiensis]